MSVSSLVVCLNALRLGHVRRGGPDVNILAILIPVSVLLGLVGLAAFLWLLRHDQFEDPEGQAARILSDRYDDAPAEDAPARIPPAESGRAPLKPLHDSRRKPLDAPARLP